MQSIKKLLSNILHPAGIVALVFSLGLPAFIAWAGNQGYGGPEMKELIGKLDLNFPFWLFSVQAILFVLLFVDLAKDFKNFAMSLNPGRNWSIVLGLLVLVLTIVTGSWIEGRHRVQSDESIFLSTAQNLYSEQVAGACDEGEFTDGTLECTKNANNFKARGLAFVYLIGMPILGHDLQWVFAFHLVLYFLTGLLAFFAVFAWTKNHFLAIVTTIALLVQPTVMFQFRSASVEPLYVFLSALCLLLMKWAFEKDTIRHWVILALALAFFAQTRQETAFCLGAFLLFSVPRLLSAKDLRFPAFISTLSLFSVPVLLTISYHQGYDFQGGEFAAHGNFFKDMLINWGVMYNTPVGADGLLANPFLSSMALFALLGFVTLVVLATKRRHALYWLVFLVLYHVQTYMIFENVSGDFTIEINQRYSLVFMLTFAFLIALLFETILSLVLRFIGFKPQSVQSVMGLPAALAVSVFLMALSLQYSDSFKANIMYNRNHLTTEEHEILSWLKTQPEKPRLFIYSRPWHFIGYGYSAWHYDKFRQLGGGELDALLKKYDGEVYYVRGLDCWDHQTWHKKAVEHRIASTCDDFERHYEVKPLYETVITNNFLLSINRITGTKDYDLESLAAIGVFFDQEKEDIALVSYRLAEVPPKGWHYQLWLNDSLWRSAVYQPLAIMDTLRHPNIIPGYNTIRLAILDEQGGILTMREQSAFFPRKLASALVRMQPQAATQTWSTLQINKTVNENPLRAGGGRTFSEGLGTHASARIVYQLDGRFTRFTTLVAQDEEEMGGDGMQFRILGDDKILWNSPTIKGNQLAKADVSVQGVKALILEVDSLSNKDYDHADWLEPTLFVEKP